MKKIIFLLSLTIFVSSCSNNSSTENLENQATSKKVVMSSKNKSRSFFWYDVFELNDRLDEISGLSFYNGYVYTHNDEDGDIFKLNPKNGKIISRKKFGKNNDYEGIEIVKNKAYIIKSNGKGIIYDLKTNTSKSFKTGLDKYNNVEGLCININDTNELLVACKDEPKSFYFNDYKAIYKYDLKDKELKNKPYLLIDIDELKDFVEDEFFWFTKSYKKRIKKFSPSGIAFNPKNKDLYVISAKGSSLVIFKDKKLKDIIFLDQYDLPQPEGICFDSKGNLYISSEGDGGTPKLCKFNK